MNGWMDMKRLASVMTLLTMILLLLCSPASADVITAMAIEINPEHLEKTSSYARILGYNADSNTLTVELIVPEVFDYHDIEALQPGDSIYTDGHEVLIQTIEVNDWGTYTINHEDKWGNVFLLKDLNGDYRTGCDDDYVWRTAAVIECPVKDSLLFLDYINEGDGGMVELPFVRTLEEFLDRLENSPYKFAANNVYVVFDGEGNLVTIHRYYVPWG